MLLPLQPALASVEDPAALAEYARALAADSLGAGEDAARRYAAALAAAPDNEVLAAAAFRKAIAVGDRPLAVTAAQALERSGKLGPDARLLLFADHIARGDWPGAATQLDRLERVELFSFVTPLLRAWLAHSGGKADPLPALGAIKENAPSYAYLVEHRPLLLLARGKRAEGLAALAALDEAGALTPRLRIAAAAQLARKKGRKQALALLAGDEPAIAAARARLEAGKPLRGAVATASQGIAEVLLRFAADASAAEAPELALTFARIATFLAPENAAPWLVTAELLAARESHDSALAAVARIAADDPFAADAAALRLGVLSGSGRSDAALAEAREAVSGGQRTVQGLARVGDLLSELERHGEAAEAYGAALDLKRGGAPSGEPEWTLWLLKGSALTQAGDWPAGKAALEQAYKLAPQQAVVLNHLGYSQLERRENLAEAERLIGEASRLQPEDSAITDSLGWAHYVRGDFTRAVELLERAARGQPADAAINEHLGDAYYSAGRRFEARYAWQAALTYADGKAAERLRAKIERGLRPEFAAP